MIAPVAAGVEVVGGVVAVVEAKTVTLRLLELIQKGKEDAKAGYSRVRQ